MEKKKKGITGNVFPISFHLDWQIHNGFFNGPIMAHTQILVHRWGERGAQNKNFGTVLQTEFSFIYVTSYVYSYF